MSALGWSLPAGVTALPGEEPEQTRPRCPCGAYLANQPDLSQPWEFTVKCDGRPEAYAFGPVTACGLEKPHEPHPFVLAAGTTLSWTCKRCGNAYSENQ